MRIGESFSFDSVSHESKAKAKNCRQTNHNLLENVTEGDIRKKSIAVKIIVPIVVTVC